MGMSAMKITPGLYALMGSLVSASAAFAQSPPAGAVPVTVDNFVRAESDLYFAGI